VTWEEYLSSKRIDSAAFKADDPSLWQHWCDVFEHMHPASFTSRYLYKINPLRRKYPLRHEAQHPPSPPVASKPKPVLKPKIQ
jgi:hypothetical protein